MLIHKKTGRKIAEEACYHVCDLCGKEFGNYNRIEIMSYARQDVEACPTCAPQALEQVIEDVRKTIEKYKDVPF